MALGHSFATTGTASIGRGGKVEAAMEAVGPNYRL